MVSNLSIVSMCISMGVSFLLPIVLAIYFAKKYKISFKAVGIGAIIFVVFSLILESSMHVYFLQFNNFTKKLLETPIIYAVYGALAAGIFEEAGRFIGFKYILKNMIKWKDGIAYGIGHGGIEAIIIGFFSSLNNLIYSILINTNQFNLITKSLSGKNLKLIMNAKQTLISANPALFLVSGLERCFALSIQIALSLLVLYAVKERKNIYLLLAILLHAIVDFSAALYQKGVGSVAFVETAAGVAAVIALVFIIKSKKLFKEMD